MKQSDKVVVVGASAGGVEALAQLIGALPARFPAPLLVGMHVSAQHTSHLPAILRRAGALAASHAQDGEPLRGGHIYIAPPGHDLMVVGSGVAVQPSAAQARFRPSLDALFQSVAHHHGSRSVGIVLSGALDDGAVGLGSIAAAGGTTIVQSDAAFDSMPKNALAATAVDHLVPASEVGALLVRLIGRDRLEPAAAPGPGVQRLVLDVEDTLRASAHLCDAAGGQGDPAESSPARALRRAEERIALLQRLDGRAGLAAADRAVAARQRAALESCSERLRWLLWQRSP